MILHAAELWVTLAACFLVGCLAGSLLYRAIGLTGAARLQGRMAHGIDRAVRIVEWRLFPSRFGGPVPLPRVVPVRAPEVRAAEAAGTRPVVLAAPRHGKPDDLALIRGLGKRQAARLAAIGVYHFSQVAAWTPQEAAWVGAYLGIGDGVREKDWIGQATRVAGSDDPEAAIRQPKRSDKPRARRGRSKRPKAAEDEAGSVDAVEAVEKVGDA
ncbi:MAG: hypothetical protein J0H54_12050 [Rhizobiales bacterium]|nr:hypothetical protein [Hyphomicrobiales bacterium]